MHRGRVPWLQAAAATTLWKAGARVAAVVKVPLSYVTALSRAKSRAFDAPSIVCAKGSEAHNAANPDAAAAVARRAVAHAVAALAAVEAPLMLAPAPTGADASEVVDIARSARIQANPKP